MKCIKERAKVSSLEVFSKRDKNLHTSSFDEFRTVFFGGFSFLFLGIGLMRFWYQFNFYNLHFSADYGSVTVGANLTRVAVMVLFVIILYRVGVTRTVRLIFLWSGLILMTASSLFYFIDLFFMTDSFETTRFIVGGIGLVGGEMIWIFFLQRLRPGEAFLCIAGGLALSCLLSLLAGYVNAGVMGMLNLFVPAFSIFAYWRSMDILNKREDDPHKDDDTRYRDDPQIRFGLYQVIAAFFLYALLLGMALGYPDGRLRELSQTARSLHQLLVIVILAFAIWWVLVKGRGFRISTFWYVLNGLMIISITILLSGFAYAEEYSTFFVTNAISCFYFPLIFFIHLIGRHVRTSTAILYGIIYGGALFAMSIGRIVVGLLYPYVGESPWLLITMAVVLVVEMTLLLRPGVMGDYPIGYELTALPLERRRDQSRIRHQGGKGKNAAVCDHGQKDQLEEFGEVYDLTETECKIVRLISQGRSRNVIAKNLNYSEHTIRNYTRVIYRKASVSSKQELLDKIASI